MCCAEPGRSGDAEQIGVTAGAITGHTEAQVTADDDSSSTVSEGGRCSVPFRDELVVAASRGSFSTPEKGCQRKAWTKEVYDGRQGSIEPSCLLCEAV